MAKMEDDTTDSSKLLLELASRVSGELVVLDKSGAVVWADRKIRARLDGQLEHLQSILNANDQQAWISCQVTAAHIDVGGSRVPVCVLREAAQEHDTTHQVLAAVQEVMADTSWLTQTMMEKLKAWCLAKRPNASSSDIDVLTEREREILALICEGCSDADMGRRLKLSQNTVRNHVASLYRKIGVNRRAAAIIWARERAITSYDFRFPKRRQNDHQSS